MRDLSNLSFSLVGIELIFQKVKSVKKASKKISMPPFTSITKYKLIKIRRNNKFLQNIELRTSEL